jgi:SAM-dependent methyltransferase
MHDSLLWSGPEADRVAPLTPNAWLRFDVIRRLIPPDARTVLEVGCGEGAMGVRLARGRRYLGMEPDAASSSVARQRFAAAGFGEARQGTDADLAGDERFDLVCAFEVLEHIEDDETALKAWTAHVRPGGHLMLSVPAHRDRFGPSDRMVGHFRRYDPEDMLRLLTEAGFEDIRVVQYGMPLGYVLEAARNAIGKRRLAGSAAGQDSAESVAERTAASGRLFQPRGGLRGSATRWGTAPFRLAQRGFPNVGTGLVVRAGRRG